MDDPDSVHWYFWHFNNDTDTFVVVSFKGLNKDGCLLYYLKMTTTKKKQFAFIYFFLHGHERMFVFTLLTGPLTTHGC